MTISKLTRLEQWKLKLLERLEQCEQEQYENWGKLALEIEELTERKLQALKENIELEWGKLQVRCKKWELRRQELEQREPRQREYLEQLDILKLERRAIERRKRKLLRIDRRFQQIKEQSGLRESLEQDTVYTIEKWSIKAYSFLLSLYPPTEFRMISEEEQLYVFEDDLQYAYQNGGTEEMIAISLSSLQYLAVEIVKVRKNEVVLRWFRNVIKPTQSRLWGNDEDE